MPRWLGPLTDGLGWLRYGGSVIANATGEKLVEMETVVQASTAAQEPLASVAASDPTIGASSASAFRYAFTFQHVKNFGGIFTYMTSKWALACFTLVGFPLLSMLVVYGNAMLLVYILTC